MERDKEKQFSYLQTLDFWLVCDFASLIKEKYLNDYKQYFEDDDFLYVKKSGKQKLLQEFPDICSGFLIFPDNFLQPKK